MADVEVPTTKKTKSRSRKLPKKERIIGEQVNVIPEVKNSKIQIKTFIPEDDGLKYGGSIRDQIIYNVKQARKIVENLKAYSFSEIQDTIANLFATNEQLSKLMETLPTDAEKQSLIGLRKDIIEIATDLSKKYEEMNTKPKKSVYQQVSAQVVNIVEELKKTGKEDPVIINAVLATIQQDVCEYKTFDKLVGMKGVAEVIKKIAITYKYAGYREQASSERILLLGPPGTGKSTLVRAIVAELTSIGARYMNAPISTMKNAFYGNSEKIVTYLMEVARILTDNGTKPVVIFIDEIDGLVAQGTQAGSLAQGVLAELNRELEDPDFRTKNILFVGATNEPAQIPDNLMQRFTTRLFIGNPDLSAIRQMLLKDVENYGLLSWNWLYPIYFVYSYCKKNTVSAQDFVEYAEQVLWLCGVDFDRKEHITETPGLTESDQDRLWKQLDKKIDDLNKDNTPLHPFELATKGDIPSIAKKPGEIDWDLFDFLAYMLSSKHYAGREIEQIFGNMRKTCINDAASFQQVNNQAPKQFKAWIISRKHVTRSKFDAQTRTCQQDKQLRYSLIPYAKIPFGSGDPTSKDFDRTQFLTNFLSKDISTLGSLYMVVKNGASAKFVSVLKAPTSNKNQDSSELVVSKTTVQQLQPTSEAILSNKPIEYATRHSFVLKQEAKQLKSFEFKETQWVEFYEQNYYNNPIVNLFFPNMEKFNPPSSEDLNDQNTLARILAGRPRHFGDFMEVVAQFPRSNISSWPKIIEFAEKYAEALPESLKQIAVMKGFIDEFNKAQPE